MAAGTKTLRQRDLSAGAATVAATGAFVSVAVVGARGGGVRRRAEQERGAGERRREGIAAGHRAPFHQSPGIARATLVAQCTSPSSRW